MIAHVFKLVVAKTEVAAFGVIHKDADMRMPAHDFVIPSHTVANFA